MKRILLASHGHLASGIKSALTILLGDVDYVDAIDAYVDEKNFETELSNYLLKYPNEQIIMLADLYGGSVSQIMYQKSYEPRLLLVSGINLALVLELAINNEEITEAYLMEVINTSKDMMQLMVYDDSIVDQEDFF